MTLRLHRTGIILCAVALAVALTGCGNNHPHFAGGQASGVDAADANNNGAYVQADNVTYQLQISRELNQYSTEDSQYVKGLPPGYSVTLGPTELWYGVFLWAKNQTNVPRTTSDNFEVVDTEGDVYRPLKLDTTVNPFAWTAQTLQPNTTEPGPNTVAQAGPTQGGLLLFKMSDSIYANRPLILFILNAANQKLASISLNL
ncbi:MAG: hypothetical protein WAL63_11690 [Solirubrobacteraceae bacterium]